MPRDKALVRAAGLWQTSSQQVHLTALQRDCRVSRERLAFSLAGKPLYILTPPGVGGARYRHTVTTRSTSRDAMDRESHYPLPMFVGSPQLVMGTRDTLKYLPRARVLAAYPRLEGMQIF